MRNKTILSFLIFVPYVLFGSENGTHDITHMMMTLVFQIGIIIFAAKFFGTVFEKLKMPSVLGELTAGIIIGPYLLGAIPLPGFEHGLFPVEQITTMPVSPELYGFATLASIILLFSAGLETDFSMFLKFSLAGSVLGVGGALFSFILGDFTAMYFLDTVFMDPRALFLGVISTATSVGITARILSERRKMDCPEGVSIMAGAVIDDILGIIILAVVIGISTASTTSGGKVEWGHITFVAVKAIGVWFFFTLLGLVFAYKISSFLKIFKNVSTFSVMSLGLAFLFAGVFEQAGLAMIVGAYVMGLSLSRTDLSFVIHDKLHTIQLLFVPVFFTVMGMMVNPLVLIKPEVILFGLVYTIGAIIAKIAGCGLPSLFLNFNKLGAIRIGLGMVPRGEVALIIAGIGISYGVLNDTIFGVSIMMTLLTTVIAPPLLSLALKSNKKGTRKQLDNSEKVCTQLALPSVGLTKIVGDRLIENFHEEGFFINLVEYDVKNYHIKKDEIDILISVSPYVIEFKTDEEDLSFVQNVIYETMIKFKSVVEEVQSVVDSLDIKNKIVAKGRTNKQQVRKSLSLENISTQIKGNNKKEIIHELIELANTTGSLRDPRLIESAVLERESVMSTGLADGIAIPHAKTPAVDTVSLAIGLKRSGADFESLDGKPSKIFFLILSPENEPSSHLQMVSNITSIFYEEENRERLLRCNNPQDIYDFFMK
jgi:Kef-type K+ transport system membrane component KefB/mannitol/fructose-specific phosphotransferase system IIA component (Ntr-type)